MTAHQLTVPLPGDGTAVLTLPRPLTPESLPRLEQALARTLGQLRRDMPPDSTDPGAIEYASWMPLLRA